MTLEAMMCLVISFLGLLAYEQYYENYRRLSVPSGGFS